MLPSQFFMQVSRHHTIEAECEAHKIRFTGNCWLNGGQQPSGGACWLAGISNHVSAWTAGLV